MNKKKIKTIKVWPPAIGPESPPEEIVNTGWENQFALVCLLCGIVSILYTICVLGWLVPGSGPTFIGGRYNSKPVMLEASDTYGSFFCCFLGFMQCLLAFYSVSIRRRLKAIRILAIVVDFSTLLLIIVWDLYRAAQAS